MSCCDPCTCIATVRVRQLVNADHTFDLLLDQQPSVRQQDEFWYFGTNRLLRNYDCRWSGTAEIDADTRYQVRVWNSATKQPLLTLAPLDADDRPLCLHVFSSLSDPHNDYAAPPPHQWTVDVSDEGSEIFRIEFRGQHLGYPVPLTLIDPDHDDADINRDEQLELITFAQPGQPHVYRLTKALDLADEPLSLQLETWSGNPVPLTISAGATAEDIKYAIAPNQSLTMTLADGGLTAASAALYASPDAPSLTLTVATPAFAAADLPEGETVTFSIYQADNDTFAGETLLSGNVLTITGAGSVGATADDATLWIAPTQRYLRVKAVSSSGATLATYESTLDLIAAQSLPPISAACGRGVVDLYGYADTLGDASLGPQIDWPDLRIWLTFHEVETPPTRIRNEPADRSTPDFRSDADALFDSRGRLYVWPLDPDGAEWPHLYRLNDSDSPELEPPWYVSALTGGRMQPVIEGVWLDKDAGLQMRLDPYVTVTRQSVVLKLAVHQLDTDRNGRVWIEYRSSTPPNLISGGDLTLTFAGVHCGAPDTDGALPLMPPLDPAVVDVPLNLAVDLDGQSLHFTDVTFRCRLTDLGRPEIDQTDPTWSTGYTLLATGWAGGSTANGEVTDLNGSHLLTGEDSQTFPNAPNLSFEWRTIAEGSIAEGISYQLINHTPFIPDQSAGLAGPARQVNESRWHPARQCLVVHIDGQHYYYRPKTRAVVSDDPDELLFEIDPTPPTLTWPGSGAVSVTSQPAEITLRVGPALLSTHCPQCVENQQPTPMAFELKTARRGSPDPAVGPTGGLPVTLLRRADTMWAAHVPGVRPHWLDAGDPLLPDPLHDQLWILDGLETLRLYEVPVNGGDRRPVALYRFRPLDVGWASLTDLSGDQDTPDGGLSPPYVFGWQKSSLDCESERELTLWMFGQGYDPARHLLPSAVHLKPIGREYAYGEAAYTWDHAWNRWDADPGNSEERQPDDFGLPAINVLRPDSDHRTVCVGYDKPDAGVIWIDGVERWRVFATNADQSLLPTVPPEPDNGEPGDIRRIRCQP